MSGTLIWKYTEAKSYTFFEILWPFIYVSYLLNFNSLDYVTVSSYVFHTHVSVYELC